MRIPACQLSTYSSETLTPTLHTGELPLPGLHRTLYCQIADSQTPHNHGFPHWLEQFLAKTLPAHCTISLPDAEPLSHSMATRTPRIVWSPPVAQRTKCGVRSRTMWIDRVDHFTPASAPPGESSFLQLDPPEEAYAGTRDYCWETLTTSSVFLSLSVSPGPRSLSVSATQCVSARLDEIFFTTRLNCCATLAWTVSHTMRSPAVMGRTWISRVCAVPAGRSVPRVRLRSRAHFFYCLAAR